jgi:hypothetical protein
VKVAADLEHGVGIEHVGTVGYTLDDLDLSKVQSVVDENGIKWCRLELTLNTRMADEVGHLTFRMLYLGRQVGEGELEISRI